MRNLSIIALLILLPFSAGLRAQLSAGSSSIADLLPVNVEHGYFASQEIIKSPPRLTELMLTEGELVVTNKESEANSLMNLRYRPHLAFFCRVEVKIDQAVGTPFRFRLGSVDYVDYLEGKRSDY